MKKENTVEVQFTRNCLAEGKHCEQGKKKTVPVSVAAELLGASSAKLVEKKSSGKAETASEPLAASENATVKTKKSETSSSK